MKTAIATIALGIFSLGGMSCSQLAKTGQTQADGYANYGTDATAGQAAGQTGGYYGGTGAGYGYDQAQVYPQQGQSYPQAPAQTPAYGQYETPTYQSPAPPAYTPPAYTPPAYTPPAYSGTATGGQTYTVQRGDNLYRISQNHGTSVQNLMSINGLASDVIHPGDVLTVR